MTYVLSVAKWCVLDEVVCEESIGTKMNDHDLCLDLEVVLKSHYVNHCLTFPLNISETVRDGGLVPSDHQQENAYDESNGHMTNYVTLHS